VSRALRRPGLRTLTEPSNGSHICASSELASGLMLMMEGVREGSLSRALTRRRIELEMAFASEREGILAGDGLAGVRFFEGYNSVRLLSTTLKRMITNPLTLVLLLVIVSIEVLVSVVAAMSARFSLPLLT
jgi:hypothetical protein